MTRRPPRSTRTDTLFPYTTLFRFALRGGSTKVLIPEENSKDLADIPKNVTAGLDIVPVRWIDEVLDIALEHPLKPSTQQAEPVAIGDSAEAKTATDPGTVRPH